MNQGVGECNHLHRPLDSQSYFLEIPLSSSNQREGDIHHVGERRLAFFGCCGLSGEDVVGDGADGEGPIARPGCVHVKGGSFHFHGEHTHLDPWAVGVGLVVERVG